MSAIPAWQKHIRNVDAATDVDAISETIEQVFNQIGTVGPASLDLTWCDVHQVNLEHLVAVLRASSSWRSVVPGWRNVLTAVKQALAAKGIDEHDVLVGLD